MARVVSASLSGLAARISEIRDSPRHSALVRITHWINTASFLGLLVSGFAILLAHPRFYWGETGSLATPSVLNLPLPYMKGGPSGWGRNLHFLAAWVCVLNGVLYVISGILTRHFRRNLVPAKTDLTWDSLRRVMWDHVRLIRPGAESSRAYNPLQRLTYLAVVFALLPFMIWTGFAMSPTIVSIFPGVVTLLGGQETARTLHFFAADLLVLFLLVHLAMVWLAGFRERTGAMIVSPRSASAEPAGMILTRRGLVTAGLGTAAGVAGLGVAATLADRYGLIPPDHAGVYGVGKTLTYAAQRLLTPDHAMAREFTRSDISKAFPVNGFPPTDEAYARLQAGEFADWRLSIDGLVARPARFSLDQLRRFPASTQITHQACEEGWSFIAEWTGVALSYLLNLVGVRPEAKYVFFLSFGTKQKWGSLDMSDAWHPQTLIAYGMNGDPLPALHGAPIRVRVPRQLGFKSIKYLTRITVTDTTKGYGKGWGSSSPEHGYAWYGGI